MTRLASSESQAINMAHRCGIELTPEQIERYVSERKRTDEIPFPYDSEIFARVLTPEQLQLVAKPISRRRLS